MGLYWDNGKENGNYWDYIGVYCRLSCCMQLKIQDDPGMCRDIPAKTLPQRPGLDLFHHTFIVRWAEGIKAVHAMSYSDTEPRTSAGHGGSRVMVGIYIASRAAALMLG